MSRNLIALSISTGIPMSEWETYGERGIVTAWELLKESNKAPGGSDG